ncbi:hypothetical protein U1Q18_052138 [Sarracenia purpurea var. burkii]
MNQVKRDHYDSSKAPTRIQLLLECQQNMQNIPNATFYNYIECSLSTGQFSNLFTTLAVRTAIHSNSIHLDMEFQVQPHLTLLTFTRSAKSGTCISHKNSPLGHKSIKAPYSADTPASTTAQSKHSHD